MAVGAFPLVQLATLAIRQISKPLANRLKNRAKNNPFFRNYICMPPAQLYHYFEVNVKMKMLGLGKPSNVTKLNEAAAIELGAELLGEGIIFLVAVATLIYASKKAIDDKNAVEERWKNTEKKILVLEFEVEKHRAEIQELSRLIHANKSLIKGISFFSRDNKSSNSQPKLEDKKDALHDSLKEASEKMLNI